MVHVTPFNDLMWDSGRTPTDTDVDQLISVMQTLLHDPALARYLGKGARQYAEERFNIHRFVNEWNRVFDYVCRL